RRRAACFLADFLKDGPRRSDEIKKAARQGGIAAFALRNARKPAGIRIKHGLAAGKHVTFWLLPGQTLPPDCRPPSDTPNPDALLDKAERLWLPHRAGKHADDDGLDDGDDHDAAA